VKWLYVVLPALVLLVAGVALPGLLSSTRAANERNAAATLKILASAEADFRGNDRDENKVQDFWTGDVAGLYKLGLIPREIAEADVAPLERLCPKPVPYRGYLFASMDVDRSAGIDERIYRRDTDGSGRKVHNHSKFGFSAFPAEPGVSGTYSFFINEGNTIFRKKDGERLRAWPEDEELKQITSRGDD
jgi:hypothetical protein